MKKYVSTFKRFKINLPKYNILKKRKHTIDILSENEYMEKVDENDIISERFNIIPKKAETIFQKKHNSFVKKQTLKNKQENINGDTISISNYFNASNVHPIFLKNESYEYFIKKYQSKLNEKNKKKFKKNNTQNLLISEIKNDKKYNIGMSPILSRYKSLNNSTQTIIDHQKQLYSKYLKLRNNNMEKTHFKTQDISQSSTKNKTLSSSMSHLVSTIKFDEEKDKQIKIKTKNKEYLKQIIDLKNKEKLMKLNEDILEYENSNKFVASVDERKAFNYDKFIRTSYEKFGKMYMKKKKININFRNNEGEKINMTKTQRNKFRKFNKMFLTTLNNDMDIDKEIHKKKDSEKLEEKIYEPNPTKWIDNVNNELNKKVKDYYRNLGTYILHKKKGIFYNHLKNLKKGDKAYKDAIRISQKDE